MALHGSLEQVSLRELIDLATYSSLTGSLDITGERSGRIFLFNGQIYHIECEGQIGVEALGILLNVQKGTFNVTSGARSEHQSVWGDLETLLRNAERTALRWRRLWHQVPSLHLTPVLAMPREAAKERANVTEHLLIDAIDGHKCLSEIAAELHWQAIDVVEGIAHLAAQQMVRLETMPLAPHDPVPAAQPRPVPPAIPTIDRLLAILRS
ncbi:hypothetical protein A6A03_16355 [Chloroflexus islandicus]|uniref:PatA-like N-terminal domain-containing protein n=1 Tax=Chloroflexus islandicus TaxID=1707952 RepID=A0A178M746_9CHLR|nr:DUF4388 domain-containing protein [Chloroflexus islandicus]OAN44591.1 hypothetical protein A6A03_16355 [Chloroflexus islandicus]